MSRARNYGFDRRRRDDLRRAKQEAKRQRKTDRSESGATGPEMGEAQTAGPEPGVWEWFSASRGRTTTSNVGVRPRLAENHSHTPGSGPAVCASPISGPVEIGRASCRERV